MNDVLVAGENKEESMEACDFVELGEVTEETKGSWGQVYDGALGLWR